MMRLHDIREPALPFAVVGVAIMIAVGEPRPDFSQIARPDWLTAQHT